MATTSSTSTSTLNPPRRFGPLKIGLVAITMFALPIAAAYACDRLTDNDQGASAAKAASVEQLGAKIGCRPTVQLNAAQLRQGYCGPDGKRIFITTFVTKKGQTDWVNMAKDYGAVLVGERWAIVTDPKTLEALRGKVSGEIQGSEHAH
jgi:hypothetical protein